MYLFFLFLSCTAVSSCLCIPSCPGYKNIIYVSRFYHKETQSCWKNGSVLFCNSLSTALKQRNLDNTCVIMKSDIKFTEDIVLYNINKFHITSDSNTTTITCDKPKETNVGIGFVNSSNIIMSKISFEFCGRQCNISHNRGRIYISSAVFFDNSYNVTISKVDIFRSYGYGVSIINTANVSFEHLNISYGVFTKALFDNTEYISGGGIYMQYSKNFGNLGKVHLDNCSLVYNRMKNISNHSYHDKDDLPFGYGGGVTIILLNGTEDMEFVFNKSMFKLNDALWGGGAYIYLSGAAKRNKLIFYKAKFMHNKAHYSGGGVFIKGDSNGKNVIHFMETTFRYNAAVIGGGFGQVFKFNAHRELHKESYGELLCFEDCEFSSNMGFLGRALQLQRVKASFINVNITYHVSDIDGKRVTGKGALYAFRTSLMFYGKNFIERNHQSAFVLDCTDLILNGFLKLNKNEGSNGGAMALYGHSQIILTPSSNLIFEDNYARHKGGAMFICIPGPPLKPWRTRELQIYQCFFWFNHSPNGSPSGFTGTVKFVNNAAADDYGIDIFASSVQNCGEPTNLMPIIRDWDNFTFIPPRMKRSIVTNAITIELNSTYEWNVYPGEVFTAHIYLIDEKNNAVRETINVHTTNNVSVETNEGFVVTNQNNITLALLGKEETFFDVQIETKSGVPISKSILNKKLKPCTFGYKYYKKYRKCVCDVAGNTARGIAECYGKDVYLFQNHWVSQSSNNTDKQSSHVCPTGYCDSWNDTGIYLLYQPNKQCEGGRIQTSRLCSQCKTNLSVPIGGISCIQCEDNMHWVWVSLEIMLGLSVFVFIVLFLDIDIFSCGLNLCLYSYQIMDLLYTSNQGIDPFLAIFSAIVQFTNINPSFPSQCMWYRMDNLQKMAYGFLIPGWMLLLLFMIYAYAKLRTNAYFTREKCLRAFTIIGVMAYSDIARITFSLLKSVDIDGGSYVYIYAHAEYFGREHYPYGISAIVILIFVVIGVPCLMIVSPLLKNSRFRTLANIERFVRPLLDAFSRCLKDTHIWFLSYYCLCRFVVYAVGIFMEKNPMQMSALALVCLCICVLFSIILPYSDNQMNYIEMFLLTNLTTISLFSLAVYCVYKENQQDVFRIIIRVLSYIPLLMVFTLSIYQVVSYIYQRYHDRRLQSNSKFKFSASFFFSFYFKVTNTVMEEAFAGKK